jgi:hypothetical protein
MLQQSRAIIGHQVSAGSMQIMKNQTPHPESLSSEDQECARSCCNMPAHSHGACVV